MPRTLFATDRDKGAIFSPCGTWRYQLWRGWDITKPTVMFVGLNPSTATETLDDPTIRRCINFAKSWGYGKYIMCNIYGLRSTDPAGLLTVADPNGPENDIYIHQAASEAKLIVAAWGSHKMVRQRASAVLDIIGDCHCLGTTKGGYPRHPLYILGKQQPVAYKRE